ncbi:MAG: threonine synthase [Micropepsaceae bacterium]
MKYISTRGASPAISFEDVLLSGPAPDGGLYMPEAWPQLDFRRLHGKPGLTYSTIAATILALFSGSPDWYAVIDRVTKEAYQKFSDPRVAPLREIGPHRWSLELFHGPTLAFKDFALQVLAPLMNEALTRRNSRALVIAATSGDTGAAAVDALGNQTNIDLIVLHPKGRISDVQRRQMTTSRALNVRNIAVEGTFDDTQALVKSLFADHAFAAEHRLAAINSINWVRIAVQAAYYVAAQIALSKPDISFSIPTGNFGDAFAGFVAKKLGTPMGKLIIATNENDIVAKAIQTGVYSRGRVHATMSPAMDIQVASNFERLLFEFYDRDADRTRSLMQQFEQTGSLTIDPAVLSRIQSMFIANQVLEGEMLTTIKIVNREIGLLLDPHSAVGFTATRAAGGTDDVVSLATAHPAKFPEAVASATGLHPVLPEHLRWILQAPERCDTLPNDLAALKSYIEKKPSVH